jgi:ubiquinone/menaquinone biosynthesis C-methylase UbiE
VVLVVLPEAASPAHALDLYLTLTGMSNTQCKRQAGSTEALRMTSTLETPVETSLARAVLDAARLSPGDRVLDVGCGTGDTTLHAARRVGPSGLALGVDTSLRMLEHARRRAAGAGLAHVGFVHADAQTQRFAPLRFDAIVSTRGLDVFVDPAAGVANLARALRAGGGLAFVSADDPARDRAILTRAGFVDVACLAAGLMSARPPA